MSETRWTPGPWYRHDKGGMGLCEIGAGDWEDNWPEWSICTVWDGMSEAEFNAHLIAAAPELYEALAEMEVTCFAHDRDATEAFQLARAALAKARGE